VRDYLSFLNDGKPKPMAIAHDNGWNRLSLEAQNEIMEGALALRRIHAHEDYHHWHAVGRALLRLQHEAMHLSGSNSPQGRAYTAMRAALGSRVPDLETINKTARAHAVWLAQNFAAVEAWRATLPDDARLQMNHPSVIRRRYDAAHGLASPPGRPRRLEMLDTSATSARQLIDTFGNAAAWRFLALLEHQLEERDQDSAELSEEQLAGVKDLLSIAEPISFAVPQAGEIAHGRIDNAGCIRHAFIWPSAESPGFHHTMTLLNYPPDKIASTGFFGTGNCQSRPMRLNDYALENMLDAFLEFDRNTADWEILEANPAPLEQIRQWILAGTLT
jgi:hypothetical protein